MSLMTNRHFNDTMNDSKNRRHQAKKRQEPIAVALEQGDGMPVVRASGRGQLAEQILALAFENGVKVREDSDLATLLSAVDIDSPIPLEAFAAVAEILTYIYRANGATLELARDAEETPESEALPS